MQTEELQEQTATAILADVLRLLAANPDGDGALQMILEAAQTATGADGGVLLVFDPTLRLAVGSGKAWKVGDERLRNTFSGLPAGAFRNPRGISRQSAATVLAAPVWTGQVSAGIVLLFRGEYTAHESALHLLTGLADAAALIVRRMQAEQAHAEDRRQLINALNLVSSPLVMLDAQKTVIWLNAAAESILNISSEQAAGWAARNIVHSEALLALIEDGKPLDEWRQEGADKYFAPRMEVLRRAEGQIDGYLLIFDDITRYKALNRNHAEFIRLVGHDLRSPLTSSLGFADMLGGMLEGEEFERHLYFVGKIESGLSNIHAILENIQDAGRYDPETGFYEVSRALVDLREVARRIVHNHVIPPEKQLSTSVSTADHVPVISADPLMLDRAITNLYDNAIKYTPNGGEVEVFVRADSHQVIVGVRDTGLGISPENQKRLFQRHVRIPRQEHKKIKGTGLGLFIVRSVAQRHGGNAWVESVEGQGSTFYIGIPLKGDNIPR